MAVATINSTRRILALLLCCFLAACAPAVTLPLTPGEGPVPHSARWEKLSGGNQDPTALRALADLDVTASGGRQHLRVALLLQRPSLMRIEGIPVFGPPDFLLSINRDKLKIFFPGKNKFYLGSPSMENFAHFLPISLSPTEMVYILLGLPPPLPLAEKGKISYRESRDGDQNRLDRYLDSQIIQTLWSESSGERLTKMEITDADTELIHRVSYSNYLRLGDKVLPQQVTIASQYGDTQIIVRYDEMELSTGDEKTFDLPIPPGVTPTNIDRDNSPY